MSRKSSVSDPTTGPAIQDRPRTLDAGKVLAMVRGA